MGKRPVLHAAAAALVAAAAACGGSRGDKAGGDGARDGKLLVLRLEQHDSNYGGPEFAAAVLDRSGGAIRIHVTDRLATDGPEYERDLVRDVRRGATQIGVVPARVWDTMGITSFQALLAPFLVESLELERQILESPLAARMLEGVEGGRTVGLSIVPGPLRRPFGFRLALIGPTDYIGTRMGVRPGRVETATFHSLGATTREYLSLSGVNREGAALDPWSIAGGNGYVGRTLAANVVFWPRAEIVVMNRKAFERLTPEQREVLRAAGRDAIVARLAQIRRVETEALALVCGRRLASLVTVPPDHIAALHDAVRPVYRELERDPQTRRLIAEIRKLRDDDRADVLRCPEAGERVGAEVEGRWRASAERKDWLAAGASPRELSKGRGSMSLEVTDGRWAARQSETGRTWTGTYAVRRDVIRFTVRRCSHNPCTPGARAEHRWSVYRDTLALSPLAGRVSWWQMIAAPFKRTR